MAREKDPAKVIETIAQSIKVSQRGARRVRAHRFKELFGYQALSASRREKIEQLMAEAGIEVRPSLAEAKRDDWLVMSMPVQVPVTESQSRPGRHRRSGSRTWPRYGRIPSGRSRCTLPRRCSGRGWATTRTKKRPGSASRRPGEAPASGHIEADLLYFAGELHDVKARRAAGTRGVQAPDQGR